MDSDAAGHWGWRWGERKGKAWEAEAGPRKFTFPLVSPRLFNLSPGVTGQAAAPLQRAVPRTVPGKEEDGIFQRFSEEEEPPTRSWRCSQDTPSAPRSGVRK